MKFVLEQRDIDQVKDICESYYGVELTNDQTKSLIVSKFFNSSRID